MDVKFFPRNDYPNNVEICTHRFGKSMTYTEQSDTFRDGAKDITDYAITKGIKVGVFWGMSSVDSGYEIVAKNMLDNGQMWIDAYCHPYHSEVSGTVITEEVYEEERDELYEHLDELFGIKPVAMSYNSGNTSYADYITPDFLAGRNSGKNGGTTYGVGFGSPNNVAYSREHYKSKQSTSRWYDDAKEKVRNAWYAAGNTDPVNYSHPDYQHFYTDDIDNVVDDKIDDTLQNHGWYNNFTHWHNVISDGNLQVYKDYLDKLAEKNVNNGIYFAGYGEAVAYLVYRQIITRVAMYSPKSNPSTQLIIRLETNNDVAVDTSLLIVPISVKFSTTGTPLANKTIKCNGRNLISLGNNEYIVEIPFARFPIAVIEEV